LHQEIKFDVAHQLTMVGFREPGYLWKLGIPFVWGPIGGMGVFPWRFLPTIGMYGALYYLGYNLFNLWQMKRLTRPRRAARTAASGAVSGLIAATPENREGALKYWGCTSTVLTEVGLPRPPVERIRERAPAEPLRLVWTGLHIPRKALNLTLQALGCLPSDVNWELHVLGKGPRTSHWQHMAQQLGLAQRCQFHDWLPRDEALQIMASSHLMLITSLRDLTSTVTIEALALGLPIVCLDHCGFAGVVDDTCGIKVPLQTPASVVAGLAEGIARLARDEGLRLRLAKGAVLRAQEFSWEKKAAAVDQIYRGKMAEHEASAR
jgi:glycosyltransferase involved in cell wall biosynthesis